MISGIGTLDVGAVDIFLNSGELSPGLSPGLLTLTGNATLGSESMYRVELAGLTAGSQHDQIAASGLVGLGGQLSVEVASGYVPVIGDSFVILTCDGGCDGEFASLDGLDLGSVGVLHVSYNGNNVSLHLEES